MDSDGDKVVCEGIGVSKLKDRNSVFSRESMLGLNKLFVSEGFFDGELVEILDKEFDIVYKKNIRVLEWWN